VNKNRLCFSCGECTLDEFCKERNKKRLWLFEKKQDLVYITKELIKFVLKLAEYGVFHTDIKP
jgi:hypothetical protein